ncbi:hypothetical protein [Actinomadura macrotermitis]|uniref:Extracellular repeat, HAF family n=1 Tax=Actinomadura macrotermitis TaxID=2585200 RepID=A0A7K0BYG3_9ACTN|nr:hypothetical protein [Actinomadura macrotermitis]MQY06126.1 hypothetical protein [Actinomadura macrotermitis]
MRSLARSILVAALPLAGLAVTTPAHAEPVFCKPAATQWKAVDLGTDFTPTSINDQGLVVGSKVANPGQVPQRNVAVSWKAGTLKELGYLPFAFLRGPNSVATGVDEQGRISGYGTALDGERHAFVYRDGRLQDLGQWGVHSQGNTIGNGVVGGYIEDKKIEGDLLRKRLSALWSGGTYGLPSGGAGSQIVDMNEKGDWVGSTNLSSSTTGDDGAFNRAERGYARIGQNTTVDLGTLGGKWTLPVGINEKGVVVGTSAVDAAGVLEDAFVWDAATGMRALPGENRGRFVRPTAINTAGEIIGSYHCSDTVAGPVVWPSPTSGPLALPLPAGATSSQVVDINDKSAVIGVSSYPGSVRRATLWTKQP